MTARPTFSVAIAAYQAADTVGQAVASALAQTVPPVDVAVCDDGSTDEIDAALAQYRDRIVLVRQENRGEAAAKNAAARATSGEFVAFLDADDLYYPERLAALGELAASRPDLDVLTTNADLEVDGRVVGRYYPDIATFPAERQAEGVIASDSAIFGAVAIRRSVFEAAGGGTNLLGGRAVYNTAVRGVSRNRNPRADNNFERSGVLDAPRARGLYSTGGPRMIHSVPAIGLLALTLGLTGLPAQTPPRGADPARSARVYVSVLARGVHPLLFCVLPYTLVIKHSCGSDIRRLVSGTNQSHHCPAAG